MPTSHSPSPALLDLINYSNIFNKANPMIPDALTANNVEHLLRSVEARLSPENLHCDGEISRAQANRKRVALKAVEAELLGIRKTLLS